MFYNTFKIETETTEEVQELQTNLWNWNQPIQLDYQPPIEFPTEKKRTIFTVQEVSDYNDATLARHNPEIPRITNELYYLLNLTANLSSTETFQYYYTFDIPKASGGKRTITAPNPLLKKFQKDFAKLLIEKLYLFPHNAVHSYTTNRSIKTAIETHQQHGSNWFLKLDIHNFFPEITQETLIHNLCLFANFSYFLSQTDLTQEALQRIYGFLMYRNGLPQGSPSSPLLSNLILFTFDKLFKEYLNNLTEENNIAFTYTRYADDLLISSTRHFHQLKNTITDQCDLLLSQNYNLHLNREKIRYGSRAGKNWNLGLMLNKDNNITIGYRKKLRLKSDIYNFLKKITTIGPNYVNNDPIVRPAELQLEANKLFGRIAYFSSIEPEYALYILTEYEKQFNISFRELYKIFG